MSASPALSIPSGATRLNDPRPRLGGLVRGELRKISRQRWSWAVLTLTFAIGAVVALVLTGDRAFSDAVRSNNPAVFHGVFIAFNWTLSSIGGMVLLIVSAHLFAVEYSAGTIRVVLSRGVGRVQLLAAKLAALMVVALTLGAAFAVFGVVLLLVMVLVAGGSASLLVSEPSSVWRDAGGHLLAGAISLTVCVLLGSAAGAVGRSMAFAMAIAVGFFPADNFLSIACSIVYPVTHQPVFRDLTTYQLGADLNALPHTLLGGRENMFRPPLVPVDVTHSLVLIAVYSTVFLASAAVTTWRRDVLE